jgi:cation-transporting P-type ATPase 13A2
MSSQTSHTDIAMFSLQSLTYPYPLSTVFPLSSRTSRNDSMNRRLSVSPLRTTRLLDSRDDTCHILRFLDYRYARYILDPQTGLFGGIRYFISEHLASIALTQSCLRDWQDPSWTGVAGVQGGLKESTRCQRLALLGKNVLDIQEKSVVSLLRHEVWLIAFVDLHTNTRKRSYILSMFSKLLASFCGASTNTIIIQSA